MIPSIYHPTDWVKLFGKVDFYISVLFQLKLPNSVGQKKTKAIEHVLDELGVDINPVPTEEIITNYNELRQDIVLLYELKLALANCEYELQTLKHRLETLAPGRVSNLEAKSKHLLCDSFVLMDIIHWIFCSLL